MKTAETIKQHLKNRGRSFDAEAMIAAFYNDLEKLQVSLKLLPLDRNRGKYFPDYQFVGCSNKNLLNQSETAFSRSLFNQKYFAINGELAIYLDYEVPLSSDSAQKVDLLAYKPASNTLVAIEYKFQPGNAATGVEYGLLESYCYGYLLDKYVSSNKTGIKKEIKALLQKRTANSNERILVDQINDGEVKSEFILAGPVSYFEEFIKDGKRSDKRFDRITEIETAIRSKLATSGSKSILKGYLLLSEVSHKYCAVVDMHIKNTSFPFMSYLIETMRDVKNHVVYLPKS